MRLKTLSVTFAAALLSIGAAVAAQRANTLTVYFVDVEGGQASLFVAPSGESMLVDSGFPGDRDADRIAAAAKLEGLTQIDYFVNTHYHTDHIGGVPQVVARIPIRTFVDHGVSVETADTPGTGRGTMQAYNAYTPIRDAGRHIVGKPDDTIPIKGLNVHIVSAAAVTTTRALPGAGAANPACAESVTKDDQANTQIAGENGASLGMVIELGRFRMLDLGDLTWNHEHDLVCPRNLLGPIDLYLTTHHGQDISNNPVLVKAVAPRVAIMNNGSRKGGMIPTFQTLHAQSTLLDLWQLHFGMAAGAEHNTAEPLIANPDDTTSHYIKLSARSDGTFTLLNSRNNVSKDYAARR